MNIEYHSKYRKQNHLQTLIYFFQDAVIESHYWCLVAEPLFGQEFNMFKGMNFNSIYIFHKTHWKRFSNYFFPQNVKFKISKGVSFPVTSFAQNRYFSSVLSHSKLNDKKEFNGKRKLLIFVLSTFLHGTEKTFHSIRETWKE